MTDDKPTCRYRCCFVFAFLAVILKGICFPGAKSTHEDLRLLQRLEPTQPGFASCLRESRSCHGASKVG